MVTFTSTIYPIDAKGMVEKWLLQVKMVVNKMLFDSDTKMMVNKMLSDTKVVVNKTFGMMPYTKVAKDQDEFQVEKQMVRSLRDTIEKAVAVITILSVISSLCQL